MAGNARTRYGIAEWYGQEFTSLNAQQRKSYAEHALGEPEAEHPACPFQPNQPPCSKKGGVCSIQQYQKDPNGRLGTPVGDPVVMCPRRFEAENLVYNWLAEVAGFPLSETYIAKEVPFLTSPETRKPAGKIDMIVAHKKGDSLSWYGLEI